MRALIAVAALILLAVILLGCQGPFNSGGWDGDDDTAGRYHLRTRVGNFFDRGAC